jgi:type II secretory pathway pseudopilin PulG
MRSGREAGFTYLAVLFAVLIMGVMLGMAADVWHTTRLRERERELLFVGNEFRVAINRYYANSPVGQRHFPSDLGDLVLDPRFPDQPHRYLRRIYVDPMTGTTEWGEERNLASEIVGVYSRSEDAPLKTSGFRTRDKAFEGKVHYSEWVFAVPQVR